MHASRRAAKRLLHGLFVLGLLVLPAMAGAQAGPAFERAVEAYRRGAYEEAEALWKSCFEEPLSAEDRARIAYDLGNTAWRRGAELEAVGWYTLSLRANPGFTDAWRNLEFARAEAELPPTNRGELLATVRRLFDAISPAGSRWLLFVALTAWSLVFLLEALRGGTLWRLASVAGAFLVLAALLPWGYHLLEREADPVLVVAKPTVSLFSEPRRDLSPIAQVGAGEELERIDALPGWVRVSRPDGTRGWVPADAVFPLSFPEDGESG